MTNEQKQAVIDAIDGIGYEFAVSELEPAKGRERVEGGEYIREDIVNFQARKTTRTPIPSE